MPRRRGPTGTRVTLTIPPDIEARLTKHPKVAAEMTRVLRDIGHLADATVPVGEERHGKHLRDTQQQEVLLTPAGVVGLIGYAAWWAHFVHNGTAQHTANPWLLNAALSVLVNQRKAA